MSLVIIWNNNFRIMLNTKSFVAQILMENVYFFVSKLFFGRCKKVPKRRCYLKMIIDCPKKKKCQNVEEEECEDVPVKKCKSVKVN